MDKDIISIIKRQIISSVDYLAYREELAFKALEDIEKVVKKENNMIALSLTEKVNSILTACFASIDEVDREWAESI